MFFSFKIPKGDIYEIFTEWEHTCRTGKKRWLEINNEEDDIHLWIGKIHVLVSKIKVKQNDQTFSVQQELPNTRGVQEDRPRDAHADSSHILNCVYVPRDHHEGDNGTLGHFTGIRLKERCSVIEGTPIEQTGT